MGSSRELEEQTRVVCRRIKALDACPEKRTVSSILKLLADGGLLDFRFLDGRSSPIPREDVLRVAQIIEILASESAAAASIFMVNAVLAAAVVAILGTSEQKTSLLPDIRSGKLQLAFAMTEPNAGSDAAGMATSASRVSDGYVLNGEKIYTTGAASADVLLVVAREALVEAKNRAFSIFLVPKIAAGLTVTPLNSLSGHVHVSCHVNLCDVHVPARDVLGGQDGLGQAWKILRETGSLERLVVSCMAVGLAAAIVKRATEFSKRRQQFGQAIASFQSIQHTLVDMTILERAMRLFVQKVTSVIESGGDATQEILMAKCFCSEQLQLLVGQGMRVMGGRAYFDFEDMAKYYLEAPFSLYAGGTIEIHKMLIARSIGI